MDIRCDVRQITDIAANLEPTAGESVLLAHGGALLPGLRDNHLHLLSLAARRRSVHCGPPHVVNVEQLAHALQNCVGDGWIRGVGYHESVAGELTAKQIDRWVKDRPVRIQHRSGRLWFFNSRGAGTLDLPIREEGQLYRDDELVYRRLPSSEDVAAELRDVSKELSSYGVTHVTDASPRNDDATALLLRSNCALQDVYVMGGRELSEGHRKIVLDDWDLPNFESLRDQIRQSHDLRRPVAIHCVSLVEVVFAVAALAEAGVVFGDRLEHATELTSEVMRQIKALQLEIVANPNFLFSRGDQYLQDNANSVLNTLYPIRSVQAIGIRCTGGTDAPFGELDPWVAIRAATNRRTRDEKVIGGQESISPDAALGLFLPNHESSKEIQAAINLGKPANFCLLARPWEEARHRLDSRDVRATVRAGRITFECE